MCLRAYAEKIIENTLISFKFRAVGLNFFVYTLEQSKTHDFSWKKSWFWVFYGKKIVYTQPRPASPAAACKPSRGLQAQPRPASPAAACKPSRGLQAQPRPASPAAVQSPAAARKPSGGPQAQRRPASPAAARKPSGSPKPSGGPQAQPPARKPACELARLRRMYIHINLFVDEQAPRQIIHANIRRAQLYAIFYNLSKNCLLGNYGIDIFRHVQIVQKNEMQKVIHSFPSKMERYLSTIKTFKNSIKGIYTPSYTQYPPLFYFFLGI